MSKIVSIKDFLTYMGYFLLHFFYIFPIKKNRIIFHSRAGKQYSCNPKVITERMLEDNKNYEIVWAFKEPQHFEYLKQMGITVCKIRSLTFYYYRMTSKVIVTNEMFEGEIPKRKKQLKINTWHGGGGGYKRIDYTGEKSLRERIELSKTDVFCASSMTSLNNTVRIAFNHKGLYFPGTPRNDIFFREIDSSLKKNVCDFLGLEETCKLLLYAPTYRDSHELNFDSNIDYSKLLKSIEEKFKGKWIILVRMHSAVRDYKIPKSQYIVDATKYPDMQDLLAVCDCMITDYSSSIWDYSFTKRPCFLYCFDLKEYRENRGFNKPIEEWGLPIAENNDELIRCIEEYDNELHCKAMDQQHKINGSFEDGKSTDDMVFLIKAYCCNDPDFPKKYRLLES